ncbi:MAG: hypothetical protein XD91_1258, partial [Clostridiales bacterium 38_11]
DLLGKFVSNVSDYTQLRIYKINN